MFRCNVKHINNKARGAVFGIRQKVKNIGNLPPTHWLHIYESMIEPVLLYGSDLWGASVKCTADINKIYLWYIRNLLNVKATTSNIITMGESGVIPPKTRCHQNAILYFIRLNSMPTGSLVKSVFLELKHLHNMGVNTWYSKVIELARYYKIDPLMFTYCDRTKLEVKTITKNIFIQKWTADLQNVALNPSLRTYNLFKKNFVTEPYLSLIKKPKYLIAFSRFRAGSHILEVERGRYTNPRTPINQRLCIICQELEDELHFLIECRIYENERTLLFNKIYAVYPFLFELDRREKFTFMMSNTNEKVLSWVGKFIYHSMKTRADYHMHHT